MKTFSEFLTTQLQETTIPNHLLYRADDLTWDHLGNVDEATRESMSKAMTHGQHTHFPLKGIGMDSNPDVIEHLVHQGYRIKDYQKGLVTRKKVVGDGVTIPKTEKWVDERIGSVLEKTKAPDHVKKAFMNDPSRSASAGKDELHVVVSHHPYAVAGMSTGTGWSSCMNMDRSDRGGMVDNTRYLSDDSKNGTHVAYLVRGSDEEGLKHGTPSNPIARIALKPFHSEEGHTIFRPESGKQYGSGGTAFGHAVHNWAVTNYPAKPATEYTKNSDVYNDDGNTTYEEHDTPSLRESLKNNKLPNELHPDEVSDLIDHAHELHKEETASHKAEGLTYDYATPLLKGRLDKIGRVRNLTAANVHALYQINKSKGFDQPGNNNNHTLAVLHGDKFSTSMLNEYSGEHGTLTNRMLSSKTLTPELIEKHVPVSDYGKLHPSKITKPMMDNVVTSYLNGQSGSHSLVGDLKQHLQPEHIDRLVDYAHQTIRGGNFDKLHGVVYTSSHFTKEHYTKLADAVNFRVSGPDYDRYSSKDLVVQHQLLNSPHADFDSSYKFTTSKKLQILANNPAVDKEEVKNHIMKALDKQEPTTFGAKHLVNATGMHEIPKEVGDQFTKEDYHKLADIGAEVPFANDEHSNKLLDAYHAKAEKLDSAINHHVESKMDEDEDYDVDEDEDHEKLKDQLHAHMANYARNISNHIDKHVESEDRGVLKDYDEKEKTLGRFDKIDQMDNYKTENNSNHFYDEHEHYMDHFADERQRMHEMNEPDDDHDWD